LTAVTDGRTTDEAASIDAAALAQAEESLRITVQPGASGEWPIRTSPFFASARTLSALESIEGFGSGATPQLARLRAVMECAERYAQFGCLDPPVAVVDSFDSLGTEPIAPTACGLYSARQYSTAGFGLAPFSPSATIEWVAIADLASGARRLLPVEFFYPRANLKRPRLVLESSSGTAAHTEPEAATRAALCEVIERDCLLLFWYRRPRTIAVAIDAIPAPDIREDLRRLQLMGFVVTVCALAYDLDAPCFLIVGLRGESFIYGGGCHPDWHRALTHAVTELGQSLRQLMATPTATVISRSLPDVRTPGDHYGLFNRGPLHGVLRQVLAQTLERADSVPWCSTRQAPMSDARAVEALLNLLAARGLRAYGCDLTPPELAGCGVHVRRVLVPGLIPIHFGLGRLRLGCRRLWDTGPPGRLRTMLPHCFA
jgi:ribosomal protein S12 methylthiotransferase accessory factor